MALDLDATPRTTWFGFSPAVVLVLAVAVLAAGFFVRRGGESYAEQIHSACRASADYNGNPANQDDTFVRFRTAAELKLAALRAIEPPGDRAALHARLIAGEQRVVVAAQAGSAEFAGREISNTPAFGPLFQAALSAAREEQALYHSSFELDDCVF